MFDNDSHYGPIALLLVLAALVLVGCDSDTDREADLTIVASNSIVADLTAQVAGPEVEVVTIVPPGADAHTFEFSPSDIREVASADLIVSNGLGFEPFLDELIAGANSSAPRVELAEKLAPVIAGDDEDDDGHDHGHGEHEVDPHVWQSPRNAQAMVASATDALVAVDPANAEVYRQRAERYSARLRRLDAEFTTLFGSLPAERRVLVTNHETLAYLARDYDLTVATTVVPGASTDAVEPSAADLADVIATVKRHAAPAIFADNVGSPEVARVIAEQTGALLVTDIYTESLGDSGSGADTYLAMMRHNGVTIHAALAGTR